MGDGDNHQELALVRRELTPSAWSMLQDGGQLPATLTQEAYAAEIQAGRLMLLSGELHGRQVLTVIIRTEDLIDGGRELCIVAVAGENIGVNYTSAVMPALEAEAAGLGYRSVLARTAERGMARKLCLLGYSFCEATFRKELS